MKTLIGIVTFGNLPFTQLTIRSIQETTRSPVDFFIIVGKPEDQATATWLEEMHLDYNWHRDLNRGFPASINDIYDYAWPRGDGLTNIERDYDHVIIAGNDIVAYPNAVDALIDCAATTDWEWICSSQFDSRSLVERYPAARPFFIGPHLRFSDFAARPWELHQEFHPPGLQPDCIKDVRNLCLFKRSVFEKIGYADVNFYPGGYFEDNDYCVRGHRAGV